MNLPALFSRLPGLKSLTGLGAGVANALAKPVGTNGSPQLYGEAMAPTAIKVPDMTGLIPDPGYIGLNGGLLSVGDGVAVGGKLVAARRIAGSRVMNFGTQTQASAFLKLVGVPFTAAEMAIGKSMSVSGSLSIGMTRNGGSISGITEIRFGTCLTPYSTAGYAGGWYAAADTGTTGISNPSRIKYEIASGSKPMPVIGQTNTVFGLDFVKTVVGSAPVFIDNFWGSPFANIAAGSATELCFMIHIYRSAASGNYTPTSHLLDVIWDLNVEVF